MVWKLIFNCGTKISSPTVHDLETKWNCVGNLLEIIFSTHQLITNSTIPTMQAKDFAIFRSLLSEVHRKAFGEPLAKIPHGKANTLAWLIEDATGVLLSYKSLTNYINAVLEEDPEKVNPNGATLAALAQFATGEQAQKQAAILWYKYRAGRMEAFG